VVSYRHGLPGPAHVGRDRALARTRFHQQHDEGNNLMLHHIRNIARRRDQDGASAVEYGLLVAGIAALVVTIIFVFGNTMNKSFRNSCGRFSAGASASNTSTC